MTKTNGKKLKKEVIMEKAEELFSVCGYQNTTISQIARDNNMAESSIYEYFKNKEDLLFSIAEKFFNDLISSLESHLLGVKGTENRMRKFIWHHLSFMQEHLQFTRLFILEIWSNPRFYKSEKSRSYHDYLRLLYEIVETGIKEGRFRENIDAWVGQSMITGTVNHYILSCTVLGRELDLLGKGDELEKIFFSALEKKKSLKSSIWGVGGKKEAILQAALEEFSKNGFAQTTIARISKRAGVTDPTLYEYFKSKEEILIAIPEHAVDKFLHDLREDMSSIDKPENELKLFLWHQVKSYDDYPDYYKVLLQEIRCNLKFYRTRGYRVMQEYNRELMSILKSGVETGSFRDDIDLGAARDMYFGMLDQLSLEAIIKHGTLKLTGKIEAIFDLIICAVKKYGPEQEV